MENLLRKLMDKVYYIYNHKVTTGDNKPTPSKSRLRKCAQGLHEYGKKEIPASKKQASRVEWACIHCDHKTK